MGNAWLHIHLPDIVINKSDTVKKSYIYNFKSLADYNLRFYGKSTQCHAIVTLSRMKTVVDDLKPSGDYKKPSALPENVTEVSHSHT